MADLTLAGPPAMSRAAFVAELALSPAHAEAGRMFDTLAMEGIRPEVFLGVFFVENRYGTKGVAKDHNTKSPGNVRTAEYPALSSGTTPEIPGKGKYAKYPTWVFGTADWCKRIKGPKYAGAGLLTVRTVLPKYAPKSDGNDPVKYGDTVLQMAREFGVEGEGMALNIIKDLTPFNTSGPRGHKARAVVWHVAEGSRAGVRSWFHNKASEASTHYLVCKNGDIVQFVDENVTPWANGTINKPRLSNPVVADIVNSKINPNRLTISIETEGYTGEYRSADSPLGRSLVALTRDIMQRHGIPIDDDHILGHNELDSVNRPNCPGNLDWDGLLAAVKGGSAEPQKEPIAPAMPAGYMEPGQADTYTWKDASGVIVYRKVRYFQPKDGKWYEAEWTAEQGETPFVEVG